MEFKEGDRVEAIKNCSCNFFKKGERGKVTGGGKDNYWMIDFPGHITDGPAHKNDDKTIILFRREELEGKDGTFALYEYKGLVRAESKTVTSVKKVK